jgi:tetratricopeptide (TPR) repeat protein
MPLLTAPEARTWASEIHLRAVEAFSNDREDEALALLERAVAVCPDHADSFESLGVILGRLQRYDEAISVMHRLLDVDPASVMAHSNLSLYYNQLGRIEDAEREAAAAAHAKMDHDRAARSHTEEKAREARATAEELERRADMFRQVLAIDPDDALGNFGLGELLVGQGRFEEAARHLERAIATDPGYSAAFLALGKAQTGLGEGEAAIRTYRNGIEVAAGKGDLSTANTMQERLAELSPSGSD